jgi:hypothetical protein
MKFLLIFLLVSYVLYKIAGFFFKTLVIRTVQSQQQRQQAPPPPRPVRRPSGGNVNIDYMPNEKNGKGDRNKNGEYVDFEEVKD